MFSFNLWIIVVVILIILFMYWMYSKEHLSFSSVQKRGIIDPLFKPNSKSIVDPTFKTGIIDPSFKGGKKSIVDPTF